MKKPLKAEAPAVKRGRPALPAELSRTARLEVRLTPAQKAKLETLGGVQWLRDRIDAAGPLLTSK